MLRSSSFIALLLGLGACSPAEKAQQGPVVLAASSLQEVLEEAADQWATQGHLRPVLSFAGTPALAKQVEAGAPADIIISADEQWMDWLEERALLREGSRRDIAGNVLVLVGPREQHLIPSRAVGDDFSVLLRSLSGRIAVAEPETVPAGRYAMAALTAMGLADELSDRMVPTENVRAALALVERGEAELGIVYATDAAASDKVSVVARFDPESYPSIRYPMAVLAGSPHEDAESFAAFLVFGQFEQLLSEHGFEVLP